MAFFEEVKTEQRGRLSVFFFVEVFMHCRVLGKTAGNHTRLSSCRKGPFRGCREGCAAQLLYSAVLCILQTHLPAGGRGLSCNKAAIGILINEISTSNYLQIAFILEVSTRPFLSIDFKEKINWIKGSSTHKLRLFVNFVKKYNLTYVYYFT